MANPKDMEYMVVGELSEDCSSLNFLHHKALRRHIKHLVGEKLQITFKVFKYMKSIAQLRWLWGVAYITIQRFLKETQGQEYSKEDIHQYNTQYVLNKGESGRSIVFSEDEFKDFVDDFITIVGTKSEKDVRKIVSGFSDKLVCNVEIKEVLGQRVVVMADYKRVSKLTVKGFNTLKEELQEFWGKLDCEIKDPIAKTNNLITDFIDE